MKRPDEITQAWQASQTSHEDRREFADYVDSFFQHDVQQDSSTKAQTKSTQLNETTTSTHTGDFDMQDNVINAFNDQAKAMYAPMAKFNSLLVESMEKLTEFQLNTIKSYAEIGLNQMKNAVSIQDAEGLRQFTASQAEATSIINKKILEDAKAMSDMAADFRNKIEDVMVQSRQAAEKTATSAANVAKKAS